MPANKTSSVLIFAGFVLFALLLGAGLASFAAPAGAAGAGALGPVLGQPASNVITGTVTWQETGDPVADARVVARDRRTGEIVSETRTDDKGEYMLPVGVGDWVIEVVSGDKYFGYGFPVTVFPHESYYLSFAVTDRPPTPTPGPTNTPTQTPSATPTLRPAQMTATAQSAAATAVADVATSVALAATAQANPTAATATARAVRATTTAQAAAAATSAALGTPTATPPPPGALPASGSRTDGGPLALSMLLLAVCLTVAGLLTRKVRVARARPYPPKG